MGNVDENGRNSDSDNEELPSNAEQAAADKELERLYQKFSELRPLVPHFKRPKYENENKDACSDTCTDNE